MTEQEANEILRLEVIRRLQNFRFMLFAAPGHEHLYGFFDIMCRIVLFRKELQPDEIHELNLTINALHQEYLDYKERRYLNYRYRIYSNKCAECATRLSNVLHRKEEKNSSNKVEDSDIPQKIIGNQFLVYGDNNKVATWSSDISDLMKETDYNNAEGIGFEIVLLNLFREANKIGKVWSKDAGLRAVKLTQIGISSIKGYLSNSQNVAIFAQINKFIDVFSFRDMYGQIIDSIENSENKPSESVFDAIELLEELIELQLEFYLLWVETDATLFLSQWTVEQVIDLMELYDDNKFEFFLKKIASIKNEKSAKIIDFYLHDDEVKVREFARQLQNQ